MTPGLTWAAGLVALGLLICVLGVLNELSLWRHEWLVRRILVSAGFTVLLVVVILLVYLIVNQKLT